MLSVIKRKEHDRFINTVNRIKAHFYLPNYITKLTGFIKLSGNGYWATHCPMCQKEGAKMNNRKFWLNRDRCGCFNPKCVLCRDTLGYCDVITLHAKLNNLSQSEAIRDLAKNLPCS